MNSSGRKRLLRDRIERGEYTPKIPLMKPARAKPGTGLLHLSKGFRSDLAQAYVEDAFQRPHLLHRCRVQQDAPKPTRRVKRPPHKLIAL